MEKKKLKDPPRSLQGPSKLKGNKINIHIPGIYYLIWHWEFLTRLIFLIPLLTERFLK